MMAVSCLISEPHRKHRNRGQYIHSQLDFYQNFLHCIDDHQDRESEGSQGGNSQGVDLIVAHDSHDLHDLWPV